MHHIVDVEGLLGREILSFTDRYRNRLTNAALAYWRAAGFPYPTVSAAEIRRELDNLAASDNHINGHARGLLSTVGVRVANASHPQLWRIKTRGKSCVDIFADDDRLRRALTRAPLFWPDRRCWNAQSIRAMMRISHKMRPSNFRPVVARQLIRAFSDDGDCVFDFSAGFGGRLLGAVSLDRTYIGIDPARAQISGLRRLYGCVKEYVPGRSRLYEACAEDLLPDFSSQSADLIISSPPYFDTERYSAEENQSYLRYSELPQWIESFLSPVLRHSARILKPGGVMLLNVTDRKDINLKRFTIDLCVPRLEFLGWIPYCMRINPGCQSRVAWKNEPILVFQKPPVNCNAIHRKIRTFSGRIA